MTIRNKTKTKKQAFITINDVFFYSGHLQKFINKFMRCGKKRIIESAVRTAFLNIKKKLKYAPIVLFYSGVIYSKSVVTVVKKRQGRKYLNVPTIVPIKKQILLALKNIVLSIRTKKKGNLSKKIETEFVSKPYVKKYLKNMVSSAKNKRLARLEKERLLKQKKKLWEDVSVLAKSKLKKEIFIQKIKIWKKPSVVTTELLKKQTDIAEYRVNSRKRWI